MWIVINIIITIIFGAILYRLIYRAVMRAKYAIKTAAGIDVIETVEIGGIKQILYFRGRNKNNPVIFYLHGGPASPEMQFLHGFQYSWEDDFTIVHWEQRQAGKTFLANNPDEAAKNTDFDRILEDAWEITRYIQQKLGKEKIIILGHSWGTVLGTALAQKHPEAYSAYIGAAQIINFRENERISHNLTLNKAKEAGSEKDAAAITALGSYLSGDYDKNKLKDFVKMRNYQDKYDTGAGVGLKTVLLALTSPYYTLRDTFVMFGKVWDYQDALFRYLLEEHNAEDYGTDYKMPVYYVMGENDFLASRELAQNFLNKITAPDKRLFIIPGAGHMMMTDNPIEFARVLINEIKPRIGKEN